MLGASRVVAFTCSSVPHQERQSTCFVVLPVAVKTLLVFKAMRVAQELGVDPSVDCCFGVCMPGIMLGMFSAERCSSTRLRSLPEAAAQRSLAALLLPACMIWLVLFAPEMQSCPQERCWLSGPHDALYLSLFFPSRCVCVCLRAWARSFWRGIVTYRIFEVSLEY